jgi:acetyl-CoA carboxylase biotin carboxyl carrier protein
VSDEVARIDAIEVAAARLIPDLTERLARHGLGEIEVRSGDLRVRVVAPPTSGAATVADRGAATPSAQLMAARPLQPASSGSQARSAPEAQGVRSPAVGYFAYADGLGPGLAVEKGDALGHVEVLGVRHDVRAPRSGVVRNLVTEAGEAVEYGQLLIELEAAAT